MTFWTIFISRFGFLTPRWLFSGEFDRIFWLGDLSGRNLRIETCQKNTQKPLISPDLSKHHFVKKHMYMSLNRLTMCRILSTDPFLLICNFHPQMIHLSNLQKKTAFSPTSKGLTSSEPKLSQTGKAVVRFTRGDGRSPSWRFDPSTFDGMDRSGWISGWSS